MKNQYEISFLGDMGISMKTIGWLREHGFDAVHLRERKQQKLPDNEIVREAIRDKRIILTMDLDFGFLLASQSLILPSVIIFRLQDETPISVNRHLQVILTRFQQSLKNGAIISVTEEKYRIRVFPITN